MGERHVSIKSILTEQFKPFWRASRAKEHLRYVLKGGRGSGKSFHIPMRILLDIMEYPVSALGIRKVQNTILKSVYANFKAAANIMGVRDDFRFVDSKLEITYLGRGNKIYFAGADDPEKIKSIKDADFPLAIVWFEELAEFKSEDDVTTIENSILREELEGKIFSQAERQQAYPFDYSFYYSYNPPKRKQSWVNKKYEGSFIDANTYVHHSTYLGNPHLSKKFIEEAENVKRNKPLKYRWEYMGEAIGSGVVPFDNLQVKAGSITDEMAKSFDNIRNGIDYGYATDPLAFVRWHYDKKKNGIYAIDEVYGVKISNRELSNKLHAKGYENDRIAAESAEPKSNAELKNELGIKRLYTVKKGPDSVEYGEEWLDDLDFICIDPLRTPNIAKEFENIDYQTDRDGNPLPRLEDKDNHTIDATRYAFEEDMKTNTKLKVSNKSRLGLR
ncbi:PBSX family phage terminase large subunit [Solibacillus sp. R5-41]|uniref:PBSX family phage terminase large subunit n=1 Tax=Solibacillus sp. R5-41 TaxID=2048654 RepID=UPI000C129436|nr:PBSX family phage terminase large subunit [Solibacillus sp. R5-41]ATP40708.1 PBSX family phage terminase large subunit [Solibacillus sp. R5-41]